MGFDGVFERFPWDTLFCAAHAETKEQRVIKLSDFQDDCTIAVLCSKPSTIRGRGRRGGGKERKSVAKSEPMVALRPVTLRSYLHVHSSGMR